MDTKENKAPAEESQSVRLRSPDGIHRFHGASSNGLIKFAFFDAEGRDFVSPALNQQQMNETVQRLRQEGWTSEQESVPE